MYISKQIVVNGSLVRSVFHKEAAKRAKKCFDFSKSITVWGMSLHFLVCAEKLQV
jgi:hypothetical protein